MYRKTGKRETLFSREMGPSISPKHQSLRKMIRPSQPVSMASDMANTP